MPTLLITSAQRRLDALLPSLQCPRTWGAPRGATEGMDFGAAALAKLAAESHVSKALDAVSLETRAWCVVVRKLHAAGGMLGLRVEAARRLLYECYMCLLPDLGRGCDLTRKYGEALRHALDATWLVMVVEQAEKPEPDELLDRIVPWDSLPVDQQAALHAMHSATPGLHRSEAESLLRQAVSLSPEEPQWRFMLGVAMQERRLAGGQGEEGDEEEDAPTLPQPSAEELSLLREAFEWLVSEGCPDAYLPLSTALLQDAQGDKANVLLEYSTKWFKDCPRSLCDRSQMAMTISRLTDKDRHDPLEMVGYARALLFRAKSLLGEQAYVISLRLAQVCVEACGQCKRAYELGLDDEALDHLDVVMAFDPTNATAANIKKSIVAMRTQRNDPGGTFHVIVMDNASFLRTRHPRRLMRTKVVWDDAGPHDFVEVLNGGGDDDAAAGDLLSALSDAELSALAADWRRDRDPLFAALDARVPAQWQHREVTVAFLRRAVPDVLRAMAHRSPHGLEMRVVAGGEPAGLTSSYDVYVTQHPAAGGRLAVALGSKDLGVFAFHYRHVPRSSSSSGATASSSARGPQREGEGGRAAGDQRKKHNKRKKPHRRRAR